MKYEWYARWAEEFGPMSRARAELLGRRLPRLFRETYRGAGQRFYGGPGLLFCRIVCDFMSEVPPQDDDELRAARVRIDDLVKP